MLHRNISILWDFDGTLTPVDSTTETLKTLGKNSPRKFWKEIRNLRGDRRKPKWEHILASDTPIWMYTLSRIAHQKKVPLNKEFFKEFVVPKIKLYPNVFEFLRKIKKIENRTDFKSYGIKIYHFIISAGLKDLIEEVFPENLIEWTFGGRYTIIYSSEDERDQPESVPAFCMDETMKTRSVFEIAKGTFSDQRAPVNKRIRPEKLKFPFSNMIYIGDGTTDIPALALVKDRGGLGVIVYDRKKSLRTIQRKLKQMSFDYRADLIAPADFSSNSELFQFIEAHCYKVLRFYKAKDFPRIENG